MIHTENQLPSLPRTALNVAAGGLVIRDSKVHNFPNSRLFVTKYFQKENTGANDLWMLVKLLLTECSRDSIRYFNSSRKLS
jgi:hypothetical protein